MKKRERTPKEANRMFHIFSKKNKSPIQKSYDPAIRRPVLHCSICTGEQVAGFQRLDDGRFEEVMLIRDESDLQSFRDQYGITDEIEKIY